jgi:hypothetical protein
MTYIAKIQLPHNDIYMLKWSSIINRPLFIIDDQHFSKFFLFIIDDQNFSKFFLFFFIFETSSDCDPSLLREILEG